MWAIITEELCDANIEYGIQEENTRDTKNTEKTLLDTNITQGKQDENACDTSTTADTVSDGAKGGQ